MLLFSVNREGKKTLMQQVYEQIRESILKQEFKAGERIPSSRELATNIGVSRNVVLEAYDQLIIEGYLEVRPQSGTYVSEGTSFLYHSSNVQVETEVKLKAARKALSNKDINFKAGNPAMDYFPRKLWGQLTKEVCLDSDASLFGYNHAEGLENLREVLASYLSRVRGVNCHPDQIIMTTGATQGLYLITKLLNKPGSPIIIEDPIADEMLPIFTNAGAKVRKVPVDENGLITDQLPKDESPSFTFVVPSHQFPLGGTLPIQRRIQLIEFARKNNSYIVEDDYDSEFTYEGVPVPAIQGLDPDRVIYVGTFSKILSPSLRLGYLVLPWSLVKLFREKKWFMDRHTGSIEQMVLATFIQKGYLDRHVRRMKNIYKKRRKALVQSIHKHFKNYNILGTEAGMHLVLELEGIIFSKEFFQTLREHGLIVYPISGDKHRSKIVMGYGGLTEEKIEEGICKLKKIIFENYYSDLLNV